MTSSTWSFEARAPLLACGVDIEDMRRFEAVAGEAGHPMPFVFTARELELARGLASPAAQLCAAFSCKEALYKGLGTPYDFVECELLWNAEDGEGPLALAPALGRDHELGAARAAIRENPANRSELIAAVYLFQK